MLPRQHKISVSFPRTFKEKNPMPKPTGGTHLSVTQGIPHRDSKPSHHPSQHPLLEKATLVLEGNELAAWSLPIAMRMVPLEGVRCTLVQAMANVSQGGWIHAEPDTFWNAISERRQVLQETRQQYSQQLVSISGRPVEEWVSDTSHEGQEQLLERLEAEQTDLLIVGCREQGGLQKPYKTSAYATHLATHAPCSTLLVKRPFLPEREKPKLLFATDGSEASIRAAGQVSTFVRADVMDVVVVTVLNPVYLENPIIGPYINTQAVDEAFTQNSEMILEGARAILESQGLSVSRTYFTLGTPSWELMNQIKLEDPDLVVVGSHNRKGPISWFLGSVSYRVVQSGQHSVLVVR